MSHLIYSTEFENGHFKAFLKAIGRLTIDWLAARIARYNNINRQWTNRQAFKNLLGKEDWVYADMGVNRGDVEWAARLPLHINAAKELEKIRERTAHK